MGLSEGRPRMWPRRLRLRSPAQLLWEMSLLPQPRVVVVVLVVVLVVVVVMDPVSLPPPPPGERRPRTCATLLCTCCTNKNRAVVRQ